MILKMELAGWPHLKKLEDEMTEQTIDELIDELVQQTLNCVEGPVAALAELIAERDEMAGWLEKANQALRDIADHLYTADRDRRIARAALNPEEVKP